MNRLRSGRVASSPNHGSRVLDVTFPLISVHPIMGEDLSGSLQLTRSSTTRSLD